MKHVRTALLFYTTSGLWDAYEVGRIAIFIKKFNDRLGYDTSATRNLFSVIQGKRRTK